MLNDRLGVLRQLFFEHDNVPYVILRNWINLGNESIDVLVNDPKEFVLAFGLKKSRPSESSATFKWRFGVKYIQFEIRTINENYFPLELAERILKGRVRDVENGFYIVNPNDQFVSILYHSIYHKDTFNADDQIRLSALRPEKFEAQVTDKVYGHQYLVKLGYFPVKCLDETVELHLPETKGPNE